MLNETGKQKALQIAERFNELLESVTSIALDGSKEISREMAIVHTKLEEACFFAKKAMANRKENQQTESDLYPTPLNPTPPRGTQFVAPAPSARI